MRTAYLTRSIGGLTLAGLTALALTVAPSAVGAPAGLVAPALESGCDPFAPPVVDPGVPTARDVIGIDLGDRDVTTAESDSYLQAVSAASPKVADGVLATSVQGRPLRYAVDTGWARARRTILISAWRPVPPPVRIRRTPTARRRMASDWLPG